MKNIFISLRPHQWIKNLFILLPIIFGNKLFVYPANLKTLIAFSLFCITSSVVYLINDLIDLEEDKNHPVKKLRPLASGKISLKKVKVVIIVLWLISLIASFYLNLYFGWIIVCYLVLNILYSSYLKKIVIIEVLCIGAFFLLRIIAGTIIAEVDFSHWMIFMTVLLAIFLGFNKRRQELKHYKDNAPIQRYVLTKYNTYFLDQMISVTTASIVVVYMLYTVDYRTINLFGTNHLSYSIPFVYYGIFRYLYLVHKENKDGDPTNLLLSDRVLQINILLWIITCISVIYFKI